MKISKRKRCAEITTVTEHSLTMTPKRKANKGRQYTNSKPKKSKATSSLFTSKYYENTPIQNYLKFHHQKLKIVR